MMEFLTYDLKVAALIAVFYMFYRLLLAKETLHRMNRMVLLLTAVASFVLPLCVITMHETVVVSGTMGQVSFDGLAAAIAEPEVSVADCAARPVYNRYGGHAWLHPLLHHESMAPHQEQRASC